jgi:hypothetical protein
MFFFSTINPFLSIFKGNWIRPFMVKTSCFIILVFAPFLVKAQDYIAVDSVRSMHARQQAYLHPDSLGKIHIEKYLFPGGQISQIITYQTIASHWINAAELFEANLSYTVDSVVYERKWISTLIYFYNDGWILDHIEKYDSIQPPWPYLNHPDSEIELKAPEPVIYIRQCTGCNAHFSIPVINYSDQFIGLTMTGNNYNIVPDLSTFMIPPEAQVEIGFTLTLDASFHQYDISLSNDSITRTFRIQSFGYDLAGTEIKPDASLTLPRTFYYLPSANESLLTIYDRKRKEVLLRIPLGRANQAVDLTALKPGKYWIERTDFETGSEGCFLVLTE